MCCPRILVVDDDEFNIHALTVLLEHFGQLSDSALNGEIALEMIRDKLQEPC